MKIAVISDLHIGSNETKDLFLHSEESFLYFLNHLESNHDKIILLGDIYETMMPSKFRGYSEALLKSMSYHPKITDKFLSEKYEYIAGNHDLIALDEGIAKEQLEINLYGKRILFIHGHQFDPKIQKGYFLTEVGLYIAGKLIERNNVYKMIYMYAAGHERMHGGVSQYGDKCPFQKTAVSYAFDHGYDAIICGHTHIPSIQTHTKNKNGKPQLTYIVYMNSGTCFLERYSYLSINISDGSFSGSLESF